MAEPDQNQITIPGYRRGFNGRLSVSGYGSTAVRVMEVLYGIEIVAGGDSSQEARSRRAFYPLETVASAFGIVIVHVSYSDRLNFNKWMRGYMRAVTGGQAVNGAMKVEVPARRFVRRGICTGTLVYGQAMGDPVSTGQLGQLDPDTGAGAIQTVLDFTGAMDPLSPYSKGSLKGVSYFKASSSKAATNFYPSGVQVSGAASLEGTIFDDTPEEVYTESQIRSDYTAGRASGLIQGNVSYGNFRDLVLGSA